MAKQVMNAETDWPEAIVERVPKGLTWSDRAIRWAYSLERWRHRRRFVNNSPPPPESVSAILVNACIRGVGNIILFTPVLKALRRAYPQAQIVAVTYDNAAGELLVACPFIGTLHRISSNIRAVVRQVGSLRKRRWDLVVNVDPHWSGLVFASVPARFSVSHTGNEHFNRAGMKKREGGLYACLVPIRPGAHEVEYNLDLIRALGFSIDPKDALPVCWIPEEAETKTMELLLEGGMQGEPLITISPGSHPSQTWKRWPPERYATLADYLIKRTGRKIALLGDTEDQAICDFVQEQMEHEVLNLAGKTTVLQAAAIIRRCELFVGNDSGLMHLAAAQGVPVVAIVGPTDFFRSGPAGETHLLVDSGGACQRCYVLHPQMPTLCPFERACLMDITVFQVLQAAESLLVLGAMRPQD